MLCEIFPVGALHNLHFLILQQGRPFAHHAMPLGQDFLPPFCPILSRFYLFPILKDQRRDVVTVVVFKRVRRRKVRRNLLPYTRVRFFLGQWFWLKEKECWAT